MGMSRFKLRGGLILPIRLFTSSQLPQGCA
jgi:hypothetical protein